MCILAMSSIKLTKTKNSLFLSKKRDFSSKKQKSDSILKSFFYIKFYKSFSLSYCSLGLVVENVLYLVDHVNVWQRLLECLEKDSSRSLEIAFLEAFHFEGIEDHFVNLVAPDNFRFTWLESHYKELVTKTLQKIDPDLLGYKVRLGTSVESTPIPQLNLLPVALPKVSRVSLIQQELQHFYSHYSFDTFVQGDCNGIAFKTSMTVAENPGDKSMNPLYLYGATGLGKTHLLQSIARYMLAHRKTDKIIYRTTEQFLKDSIARYKGTPAEKKKAAEYYLETYVNADMLLLDDVQILEKKEKTQESLLHVIESLRQHNKQVVLCSDRKPVEIPNISNKLISRFEEGLTVSMDVPDLSTRLEIFRRKSVDLNFPKDEKEEILRWVATFPISNVRELEGFIAKLRAHHELMNTPLNLKTVQSLSSQTVKEDRVPLTCENILQATASFFGLDRVLLSSKKQNQAVSLPRKIAMFLCREATPETFQSIGELFNRDYATVIASVKSIKKELEKNAALSVKVNDIKRSLGI